MVGFNLFISIEAYVCELSLNCPLIGIHFDTLEKLLTLRMFNKTALEPAREFLNDWIGSK